MAFRFQYSRTRPTCSWLLAVLFALFTAGAVAALGWSKQTNSMPARTDDYLAERGWWPTKRTVTSTGFLGDSSCLKCHSGMASFQNGNAMSIAAYRAFSPASPAVLAESHRTGSFSYRFIAAAKVPLLQISSRSETSTFPITWTFGAGKHGQTYLVEHESATYEAQVSSFATNHLELTPGHVELSGDAPLQGIGNRLSTHEAERCFSCHTTAWSSEGKLNTSSLVPGVHCEACHGPGVQHVSAMRAGRVRAGASAILNPARLDPVAAIDFCGACHRTSMDILLEGPPEGVSGIRFQPYRLQKSRCWTSTEDARLTCVACHDPHKPLVHDAAFYDSKCLTCHASPVAGQVASKLQATAHACPVARSNCASCHMPKYNVPEMHSEFTDHYIRTVRQGEVFPR